MLVEERDRALNLIIYACNYLKKTLISKSMFNKKYT